MSDVNERGAAERGLRSSALWGTGTRGGDSRSSVLWGKGGRGFLTACVLVCALVIPLTASAGSPTLPVQAGAPPTGTFVAKSLLDAATNAPADKVDVIIQAKGGA